MGTDFSDFQVALIMTSKDNKSVDLTNNMCISMGISSHKHLSDHGGSTAKKPCPLFLIAAPIQMGPWHEQTKVYVEPKKSKYVVFLGVYHNDRNIMLLNIDP